jgi:hypothetical protein
MYNEPMFLREAIYTRSRNDRNFYLTSYGLNIQGQNYVKWGARYAGKKNLYSPKNREKYKKKNK